MGTGRRVERQREGDVAAGVVWVPPAVSPFLAVGVTAIVGGGVVAAVSHPAGWEQGSWLAAFLVLVVGVGQIGLGAGQSAASQGVVSGRTIAAELALGNVGASFVVVGTLSSSPLPATAGGLLFATAVGVFARHSSDGHRPRRSAHWSFVGLVVVLAVSVPIGVALTWLRA